MLTTRLSACLQWGGVTLLLLDRLVRRYISEPRPFTFFPPTFLDRLLDPLLDLRPDRDRDLRRDRDLDFRRERDLDLELLLDLDLLLCRFRNRFLGTSGISSGSICVN